MGGLPGPFRGDTDPAELHTDQTEANGPKIPEPSTVVGGYGEGFKHQTSSEVRQSHQGDSAEETPGQRETGFSSLYKILIFCASVSGFKQFTKHIILTTISKSYLSK